MGNRRAFTLVELLLVILILGALVVVAVPNIAAAMAGSQASATLRMVTQMGRYTRSMALLNQVPCDLVVDLDKRQLMAEMVARKQPMVATGEEEQGDAGSGTRFQQESLYETGAGATISFGRATSEKDRHSSERILERNRPMDDEEPMSDEEAGALADAIRMVKKLPGDAPITFLGHSDRVERTRGRMSRVAGEGETNGVYRIRYRTNGTCRPYQIAVGLEDDLGRALVSVDAVGTPRVMREGADREAEEREEKRKW